ncbi:MAG: hypothetical protein HY805_02810 [Nitrospirae bacterium]|nr:hypothetical protein [Nitrospirota bacterium]
MEILFEVKTALDKTIRTTRSHWELIAKLKHPKMEGGKRQKGRGKMETIVHFFLDKRFGRCYYLTIVYRRG